MNLDAALFKHSRARRAVPLALLALLAACGGGEPPSATAPANPANAAPATPVAPALPASGPSGGDTPSTATCNLPDFNAAVLSRVNQFRAAGASCGSRGAFAAAPPLAWNAALRQAAEAHSRDMVANNFFSHTGADGSSSGQRIAAAGYNWSSYGENIAAGQGSVVQVVVGWMASDGHCANVMSPAFADIGVACVAGTASTAYRSYWTMDLGKSR